MGNEAKKVQKTSNTKQTKRHGMPKEDENMMERNACIFHTIKSLAVAGCSDMANKEVIKALLYSYTS